MKEKAFYILDKIASGIVFVILTSIIIFVLGGMICLLILYPIYIISIFTILFVLGYIVDKFNIIPFK